MAPLKFPPRPSQHPEGERPSHIRVPIELWQEMCVTVARYGYTRKQHPDPERFDAAVDDGIRGELALKQAPPSGVIQ